MAARSEETREVTCPHCRREFDGRLIGAGEQQGYKCPHCRLFVPVERVDEPETADRPG